MLRINRALGALITGACRALRNGRGALCLGLLGLGLLAAACSPQSGSLGPTVTTPALEANRMRTADGLNLAFHEWRPTGPATARMLALHGLNDHGANFMAESAPPLVEGGLHIFAFDQRGHARNPRPGIWPGQDALVSDAVAAIRLIRARHSDLPLFVLGESMGANVALLAAEQLRAAGESSLVDGWIFLVPGLWVLDDMNPVTAASFRLAMFQFPRLGVSSGSPAMIATDNSDTLERFNADPLTLKTTRVDVVAGLLDLNGAAKPLVATCCTAPSLFLYGARDSVFEPVPTVATLRSLPAEGGGRVGLYREGWHILLRDRQRQVVTDDILAFTRNPRAALPSGADAEGARWVAQGRM
ncbi:alpha/beta fold hydrolase [Humitalea sp. 24SJ18S-53]|uniref:alpha/beta fold hydrolase n=1 Tax=Humitalea sp. 24SJ18S-53 TaxID=3422307 RepID=UPI003D676FFA